MHKSVTVYSTPNIAFGFGPRRLGRGSRPVAAARRSRKADEPTGRPIVSAARKAETTSADGAVSIRSAKRPPQRSTSGATLDEAVVAARQMRRDARPAPVLGPLDEPRSDRVQRHIARRRHQMLLVHRRRAEPRLEQMPGHAEPGIDRGRIAPMGLTERAAKQFLPIGNENEMDVVRHQTIGPARDALFAALAREQAAVERIVIVG